MAGIRRNIKNFAHNYSEAQVKVREATSNDPWGPSPPLMAEIADLTYGLEKFADIMQMIWKRLNDSGKNWRHVHKALILLEHLIKAGTEKVAKQCKENIYAIQTLEEFSYEEEGKDLGVHVRDRAKSLVALLKDDERLKNERTKALRAKERFAQHASGFGSDGSIDGPMQRETIWVQPEPRAVSELEMVRPNSVGEEELHLQLAMAMSREEAEQEEAKRRSDDVRLQLALSQSEQDFKHPDRKKVDGKGLTTQPTSHLMDLLDISLGATKINSPSNEEPWGGAAGGNRPQTADPWSRTSSPPVDPWQPAAGQIASRVEATNEWVARTHSPSLASGSSVEGWLQNNPVAVGAANMNGNHTQSTIAPIDTWLAKNSAVQTLNPASVDPWIGKSQQPNSDPWLPTPGNLNQNNTSNMDTPADPWSASAASLGIRQSPIGAITPNADLDDFDVITNRPKNSMPTMGGGGLPLFMNGTMNNNNLLLDDLDPLATNNKAPVKKTPQSFLGENSSLVNLDNLIKPAVPNNSGNPNAYNPFGDLPTQQKTNMFQQAQPVPSINQLQSIKQTPFPSSLNQDPWAPVNNVTANQSQSNAPWLKPEAAASNPFLS